MAAAAALEVDGGRRQRAGGAAVPLGALGEVQRLGEINGEILGYDGLVITKYWDIR